MPVSPRFSNKSAKRGKYYYVSPHSERVRTGERGTVGATVSNSEIHENIFPQDNEAYLF